ncbi:hypothetical protein B0T20DRAFT_135932 [Sordaria brevicollis]|uniref:Dynamin N-terminal domain-containing protein n=1 Tax=Sordaria brevicollis TaxID=83679 RepID=A0AAE0PLL6_SORBR|nr:hypothetical protein B0T20DRAFT_135932 [Sordaria brevicollis]
MMAPPRRRSTRAHGEEINEPLVEGSHGKGNIPTKQDGKQLPIAWVACSDDDVHHRVDLKQQAVEDALRNATVLCDDIQSAAKDNKTLLIGAHPRRLFGEEIQSWIAEIDEVKKKHREYEVLVGVAGATGAGKSTILNMLLEMPELLPASNSEASTSCACKVSWNNDDDPEHKFIAEIDFRPLDDLKKELGDIFTLIAESEGDNDESEAEDYEDLVLQQAETLKGIEEGLKKIQAVWGLDKVALKGHDATSLIESDKEVLRLLGTTHTIYSADLETFSDLVKPYIDSSPTNEGFKVWPLVMEARLYVKADILQHGITLVDLPGLSDTVESRAQVAEKFYHKLGVTIIATPACRAIDEKTGVKLMSNYQTLRMQLDGRFEKKKFCVVVSKMDGIDCDVFCKGSRQAKADEALQDDLADIKSLTEKSATIEAKLRAEERKLNKLLGERQKLKGQLTALKPASRKIAKGSASERNRQKKVDIARTQNKALNGPIHKQRTLVERAGAAKRENDAKLAEHKGRVFWTCVRMRHEHIAQRITENLRNQQRVLCQRDTKFSSAPKDDVEVISVSATAFRDHLKGRKPPGFPSKRYTGLPHLRRWLENAVLHPREMHLDAVLNTLKRLLSGIQRWAKVDTGGRAVVFSRETVENRLELTHTTYTKKLEDILVNGSHRVGKLDPFADQLKGQKNCRKKSAMVAARWAFKYPEDTSSTVYMHWATFAAILKRKGGPHKTRTPEVLEYNFPDTLVVPLLESILPKWVHVFHQGIPSTEVLMMMEVHDLWDKYIDELESEIEKAAASIAPHIRDCRQTLLNVEHEIRDRVRERLEETTRLSSTVHPEFKASVKRELEPMFNECLQSIKGINSFRERRKYLQTHVRDCSETMFGRGYHSMKRKHQRQLEQLPASFAKIATFGCNKVANHIALLLGNLDAVNGSTESQVMSDQEASFQQRLGASILQWTTDWHAPKLAKRQRGIETWEIPHEYFHDEDDNGTNHEASNGESDADGEGDGEEEDEDQDMEE